MQAFLEQFITQSISYPLVVVALVAFLESLAMVGLILPGTVMMAGLGGLIGSGEINFWKAWLAAIIGCFLGDWISFWLGGFFKEWLHSLSFFKKNKIFLKKTEEALQKHRMFTILGGRFIGPIRPFIPMLAGMLDLPLIKFVVPNVIGCLFWPPFYFLPGILAGAAIDVPTNKESVHFKWFLLAVGIFLWLSAWLYWRLWCNKRAGFNQLTRYLACGRLFWVVLPILGFTVIVWLIGQPLTTVYGRILLKVLSS